jgi:hypothetical protein
MTSICLRKYGCLHFSLSKASAQRRSEVLNQALRALDQENKNLDWLTDYAQSSCDIFKERVSA